MHYLLDAAILAAPAIVLIRVLRRPHLSTPRAAVGPVAVPRAIPAKAAPAPPKKPAAAPSSVGETTPGARHLLDLPKAAFEKDSTAAMIDMMSGPGLCTPRRG